MQVFHIDEIVLGPIDIIAEDRDHAARIFVTALLEGLERHPGADFAVSEWTPKRLERYERPSHWANEGRAGVIWPSREEDDWELITYDLNDD